MAAIDYCANCGIWHEIGACRDVADRHYRHLYKMGHRAHVAIIKVTNLPADSTEPQFPREATWWGREERDAFAEGWSDAAWEYLHHEQALLERGILV